MMYANREPLASAACSRLDEAHRLAERGVVERRARRRVSPTVAHAPRRRPRRRRAPTRRPGSAPAARARARARRPRRAPPRASVSSSFSAPAASIFAGALVGRGLADLLRRRVLPGAQRPRPSAAQLALRGVGREHLVDQAGARPACARCPRRYSGSSRSRLRSITASPSADLRRAAPSTHAVASRPRLARRPCGARRRPRRPADRDTSRGTSPRACFAARLRRRRRRPRRRRGPRSR